MPQPCRVSLETPKLAWLWFAGHSLDPRLAGCNRWSPAGVPGLLRFGPGARARRLGLWHQPRYETRPERGPIRLWPVPVCATWCSWHPSSFFKEASVMGSSLKVLAKTGSTSSSILEMGMSPSPRGPEANISWRKLVSFFWRATSISALAAWRLAAAAC